MLRLWTKGQRHLAVRLLDVESPCVRLSAWLYQSSSVSCSETIAGRLVPAGFVREVDLSGLDDLFVQLVQVFFIRIVVSG